MKKIKRRGGETTSENAAGRVMKSRDKIKIRGGQKGKPSGTSVGKKRTNKRNIETGKRL
jgi:hypothetical protein